MKKSLIALAVLAAASGAAMAQSSVTLYGYGDFGYGRGTTPGDKTQMNASADVGGFRIGLRGTEDLGGGLRTNFQLESEAFGETGANGTGLQFTRAAWVGLEGGFGQVKLGRQVRPSVIAFGNFDAGGWRGTDSLSRSGLRWMINNVSTGVSSRYSSLTSYTSPNMGGFTAIVGHQLRNDVAANVTDVALTYKNGPIKAALASLRARGARASYGLGAAYDFGGFEIGGQYHNARDTVAPGSSMRGFALTAKAPMGPFSLAGQVSRNTTAKITSVELVADYALSKRTKIVSSANKTRTLQTGYFVGLYHSF